MPSTSPARPAGRRRFLRILGGGGIVLAAGAAGIGGFVATRTPSAALTPWRTAGHGDDPRIRALSYAILAPNPHNRQPWMVDLSTPGSVDLLCDPERVLPETDPFDRQIVIGLGCFLETLAIAAAEDGIRARITPFPDGRPSEGVGGTRIARIDFEPAAVDRDPLFGALLDRRSNKQPYDIDRPGAPADLATILAAAGTRVRADGSIDPTRVRALRDLTWRAHEIEMTAPAKAGESIDLMRFGKAEIEASPDGIDMGGAMLETLHLAGMLTPETLRDPNSTAFRQGLEMYRGLTQSAMGHLWIATAGNDRLDQLAAGAAWMRMNLAATRLGLAVQPLSQALQEYPEMAGAHAEVHALLAQPGETVQMLARLGHGPETAPAPRWPLASRVVG